MLLVLVFGVSAGFAADAEDGIQATDDEVDETVSAGEIETVSASDTQDKTTSTENKTLISASEDNILSAGEGSFTELASEINKGGTITLQKNYKYDSSKDSAYVEGIVINKTVTINGNGKTIDGNSLARIFNITGDNVVLKNLKLINGYKENYNAAAIHWTGSYGTLTNSIFENNVAKSNGVPHVGGGAIYVGGDYITISDCNFIKNNNTGGWADPEGGAAIYWGGHYGKLIRSNFINNTQVNYDAALQWRGYHGQILCCNFTGSRISGTSAEGSAISIYSANNVTTKGCIFKKNYGSSWGVLVVHLSPNSQVIDCTFEENDVTYGDFVSSSSNNVTIIGCTFKNCNQRNSGGAVYIGGADNKMDNCIFENCKANGNGAAVQWTGTNGELTNCKFYNNSATASGGAIYWTGTYGSLDNCEFDDNLAIRGSGGAIYWGGQYGSVSNSNFTSNSAPYRESNTNGADGGAIAWGGAYGSLTGSYFADNDCCDTGGAVIWFGNCGHVSNSTFENNVESSESFHKGAGGIAFWESSYCELEGCTFNNNQGNHGGAVSFSTNANSNTVKNCEITNNKARVTGGGICVEGNTVTITDTTFSGNTANDQSSNGLYIASGRSAYLDDNQYSATDKVTATDVTLLENRDFYISPNGKGTGKSTSDLANWTYAYEHVANGGNTIYFTQGIYTNIVNQVVAKTLNLIGLGTVTIDLQQKGRAFSITAPFVTIDNIDFINGKIVNVKGGALHWTGINGTLTNCNFRNNFAQSNSNYDGGALYWGGHNGNISYCNFYNNQVTGGSGDGGAMAIGQGANYNIIDHCLFDNNYAVSDSGGLTVWGSYNTVQYSNFTNNRAAYNGALLLYSTGNYNKLIGCIFTNNTSTGPGGAVRLENSNEVINCTFRNNTAAKEGGAIYVANFANNQISGCEFIDNTAVNGGGVYVLGANTKIDDCEFEGNNATNGGAVTIANNGGQITNSTFTGNTATTGSGVYVNANRNIEITNSSFTNNNAGNGTVYLGNNAVVDLENNDFSGNTVESGSDITVVGTITSEIVYYSPTGKGVGLTEDDPANWTTAYKNVRTGGKIVFLQGTYSDLINLSKNRIKRVIL